MCILTLVLDSRETINISEYMYMKINYTMFITTKPICNHTPSPSVACCYRGNSIQ